MKEIKEIANYKSDKFDIEIHRYLTYAEIQSVVDGLKKLSSWAEITQSIDMCILYLATNIDKTDLENLDHDFWLKSGVIDEVKSHICNIKQINEAIEYETNWMKSLNKFVNEIPEFSKKVDAVMEANKNAVGKK